MSSQKHILVVDDDPDLVEALAMKLTSKNFRVTKAYDGVEAWEKIKADPQYKNIAVILLTAVADAVASTSYTHHDGKKTLADDYIPKPIDLDKLVAAVNDNL